MLLLGSDPSFFEKPEEVVRSSRRHLAQRNVAQARYFLRDMPHQPRTVDLSPVRNRSKVWGVGFHQQALQRDPSGYVLQGSGVLEGHDARERDMETQRHGGVGHRLGLGEAVHNPPYFA